MANGAIAATIKDKAIHVVDKSARWLLGLLVTMLIFYVTLNERRWGDELKTLNFHILNSDIHETPDQKDMRIMARSQQVNTAIIRPMVSDLQQRMSRLEAKMEMAVEALGDLKDNRNK